MIKIKNISSSFVVVTFFECVNIVFNTYDKDKVGFIGQNGSSISTFLKLILSQIEAEKA
jgi:ABC-type polysaccharide/polyol phosphate transport system ATPase subunit